MGNKVDQHYVSKMILRRHGTLQKLLKKKKNEKKKKIYNTYLYNEEKNNQRFVSIDSVPYFIKYLYEIYDEDNNIKDINLLEDYFAELEENWSKILDKIEQNESLSSKDIDSIQILIAYQSVKTPDFIQALRTLSNGKTDMPEKFTDSYFMLKALCPMFEKSYEIAKSLNLYICRSEQPFILNIDCPVFKLDAIYEKSSNIVFPFSSHYCLLLTGKIYESLYIDIDNNTTENINQISFEGSRYCICRYPFKDIPIVE